MHFGLVLIKCTYINKLNSWSYIFITFETYLPPKRIICIYYLLVEFESVYHKCIYLMKTNFQLNTLVLPICTNYIKCFHRFYSAAKKSLEIVTYLLSQHYVTAFIELDLYVAHKSVSNTRKQSRIVRFHLHIYNLSFRMLLAYLMTVLAKRHNVPKRNALKIN